MKNTTNNVFIATSVDGYIADKNGSIDWLHSVTNPEQDDMGYGEFTSSMDAIIMGRTTYETVLGFGIEWPYKLPVYVLSTTLKSVPPELQDKVFVVNGAIHEVLKQVHANGHKHLYIDGGRTIQSFIKENLIDTFILTRIPVLLGSGTPLFANFEGPLNLNLIKSRTFLNQVVQLHYEKSN